MFTTRKMAVMAMLCAVSYVLLIVLHFPLIAVAPYLKFDASNVPLIIGTIMFGTVPGIIMSFVSCVIYLFTFSTSGPWGFVMNFIGSAAFVIPVGILWKVLKNRVKETPRLVICLIIGAIVTCICILPANIAITPLFTPTPREKVIDMLLPILLPFNAAKTSLTAAITFVLSVPILKYVRRIFV